MYNPTIPVKPVDRFKLSWFEVSQFDIIARSATYYVNTPYKDAFPDEGNGVPLVNDWMITYNGQRTGRCCGWASLKQTLSDPTYYATKVAAQKEVVQRLRTSIAILKETLEERHRLLSRTLDHLYAAEPNPKGGRH